MARVYARLLGYKDYYTSDREVAEELETLNPRLRQAARDNRAFLRRAVRTLATAGIDQFLDIGTGLPAAENVHEIAQRIAPGARVVYVDNDPVVLAHARALLTPSTAEGVTGYIDADARDTTTILDQAADLGLDFTRPVAVLMAAVLHFLPEGDTEAAVAALQEAVAPGSHLVISHGVQRPDTAAVTAAYQKNLGVGTPRTPEQIRELFGDWELLEPGTVALPDWRPDPRVGAPTPNRSAAGLLLGGIARKPTRAPSLDPSPASSPAPSPSST